MFTPFVPKTEDVPKNPEPQHSSFDKDLHMYGLNISFQKHVASLLEKNKSVDLTPTFQTYQRHLETIIQHSQHHVQHSQDEKDDVSDQENDNNDGEGEQAYPKTSIDPYVQDPGEEGERTEYAVRCSVYIFSVEDKKWINLGIASLRINTRNGSSRILARSQNSTRRLLFNFVLFPTFSPELELDGKSISFIGLDLDEKPAKYLVRTKTPEETQALNNTLLSIMSASNPE